MNFTSRANAPDGLTLFVQNGNCWFANYTSLESGMVFKSSRIQLTFPDDIVIIEGKNLDPIQTALATRRVVSLREAGDNPSDSEEPHINKIKIFNRKEFEEHQSK